MILLVLLLGFGAEIHAQERGRIDPLKVLSSSPHDQQTRRKTTNKPARPRRHFSPTDALRGNFVHQKEKKTKQATPPTRTLTKKKPKKTQTRRKKRSASTTSGASSAGSTAETRAPASPSIVEQIDALSPPPSASALDILNGKTDSSASQSSIHAPPATANPSTPSKLIAVPSYKTKPAPTPKKPKTQLVTGHTGKEKTLYLTFDDGPLNGTANVLRLLKEENIVATMFYIGRNVAHNPGLFRRSVSHPNVMVANHTYTHANNHYRRFYTSSIANVVKDIDRAQQLIGGAKYLRLCGRDVWRLPTVHRNDYAISVAQRAREIDKYDALANRGYFIYGWDVEWSFSYTTQRPKFGGVEMARRVNLQYRKGRNAKRGSIVLLAHDFMWRSAKDVQKLRTFVRIMKAQGWRFATIDEFSARTPAVYVRKNSPAKAPDKRAVALAQNVPSVSAPAAKKVITLSPVPAKGAQKPLAKHAPVAIRMTDLSSALTEAIRKQQFVEIRKLLAKGANINARDVHGNIPLNIAIRTNNAVLVRMLVERGAHIFNLDGKGMSPMGIARQRDNRIIIQYLLKELDKQQERKLRQTLFALR